MKKIILSPPQQEKQIIIAALFVHDNIKFLIDYNSTIYHYTDRVAMGKYNSLTKEVDFYFETQQEYDSARKNNTISVRRILEEYF
jgi:hypothetical protein